MHPAFAAFRHRNFRVFFGGQSLSLIGTWVQSTAMSWLVYRLSGSPFLLGLTGFAAQIPLLVVTPFAGVLSDRFHRRSVLLVMQAVFLVHAATLAWLAAGDLLSAWHVVVAALVLGTAMALETPSRQGFVSEIVPDRADLPNALAFNSFMQNSGRMIGPTVAGAIIHAASETGCFLANAVSKLFVIGALARTRVAAAPRKVRSTSAFEELADALRYIRATMPLRVLLKHMALVSLCATPYTVLLPVYAAEVFGGGAGTLGLLMGAAGAGGICGGLFLASRNRVRGLVRLNAAASAVAGVALMAFAFCTILWLSLALLWLLGAAIIVIVTSITTVTQVIVDDDKRGRVMAFFTMSFLGVTPLGALLAGALASAIGAPAMLFAGGAACLGAALLLARRGPEIRRHLRPIYAQLGLTEERQE